jgi:transcriptional regulator of acetoin/glycerol metabolism
MQSLIDYAWPGNVRELKSTVDTLIDNSRGIIQANDLPFHILHNQSQHLHAKREESDRLLSDENFDYIQKHGLNYFLEKIQREAMQLALQKENGVGLKATKVLGLPITSFYRYQKKFEQEQRGDDGNH